MSDKNNFGYGQLDPGSASSEFNKHAFLVDQALNLVRTATPVKVMAVTGGGVAPVGFVDVMPLINQLDGQGNSLAHATIFNVPVFRLQGGKNAIVVDPQVGDRGYLVISDRDASAVKANKAQANPGSFGRFDLSDGFYFGGFLNDAPEQYVRFKSDGIEIADKNSNTIEMGASGVSINGILINQSGQVVGNLPVLGNLQLGGAIVTIGGGAYSGSFTTSGNITSTAGTVTGATDVVGGGKHLATHVHGGVTTGLGNTGPPV